ncbi:MAG: methyltransferase domain-containing protein [Planctomycetes bacterium]|nr:methyltransferase domain-containing protein [Planctomycetota bacterium]
MRAGDRAPTALHIGSGRSYRSGFVNVDAHDPTAADVRADARRLPFADRTFASAEADHLIEHFGWGTIPYVLAECFRALRPGGSLAIETPDPGASFRAYLAADDAGEREACLAWILGRPSRGYGHRWLLDRPSLARALEDAGFQAVRFEEPQTHRYAPGIRATAARADSPLHEVIARLRLMVPRPALEDPDEAREIEGRFFANVRAGHRPDDPDGDVGGEGFLRRFRENAILSPSLAARWARLCVERGIWPRPTGERLARVAIDLERARLPAILEMAFAALCEHTNTIADGYDDILERADAAVAPSIAGRGSASHRSLAEALGVPAEPGADPAGAPVFTRAHLERRVEAWRDRGIRMLADRRLEEAEALLLRAFHAKLRYFYTSWNLAVLRTIQGDFATAAAYYRVALRFEHPGPETMLRDALARVEAPSPSSLPPPPTEAVPVGKGMWW